MVKISVLVLFISITYCKICRAIGSTTDDLSVKLLNLSNADDANEEINDGPLSKNLVKDVLLNQTENIVKTKFRIRLNFKLHDLKSYNRSTLRMEYNFKEIHQLLELNHFEIQRNSFKSSNASSVIPTLSVPCLDTSTIFHKSCFRLEEKRIELNERQSTLTKWRKNLKAFALKLNRRKNSIVQKEQKINRNKKLFDDNVLYMHNRIVELKKAQFELDKEREQISKEKLHLQNKEEQLKVYEQELQKKKNYLVNLDVIINNKTAEFYASNLEVNRSMDQYNASNCDEKTKILEHDNRYLKLCQWSASLNKKIYEFEKEKAEFEDYKMAVMNETHYQLNEVNLKFYKADLNRQETVGKKNEQ